MTNLLVFFGQGFNYTWWCRVIAPQEEQYDNVDAEGYPIYDHDLARMMRPPGDAEFINPPDGCFGDGSVALKSHAGTLNMNTSSFITYARYVRTSYHGQPR